MTMNPRLETSICVILVLISIGIIYYPPIGITNALIDLFWKLPDPVIIVSLIIGPLSILIFVAYFFVSIGCACQL